MPRLRLIAHNIRSAYNVGSLIRTAEGLGLEKLYLTGISPYPALENDVRPPHLSLKINRQIHKTALGAEAVLPIDHLPDLASAIKTVRTDGFSVAALEQSGASIKLNSYEPPASLALVVGNEVDGLSRSELKLCDQIIEIPMRGKKESFNVAIAAAMALYLLSNNT